MGNLFQVVGNYDPFTLWASYVRGSMGNFARLVGTIILFVVLPDHPKPFDQPPAGFPDSESLSWGSVMKIHVVGVCEWLLWAAGLTNELTPNLSLALKVCPKSPKTPLTTKRREWVIPQEGSPGGYCEKNCTPLPF